MTSPTLAATGQWTRTGDLPTPSSWYGRHDGAVTLTGGKVLVAGGASPGQAALTQAALYDPAAKTWAPTGALQTSRRLHTITLLDDGKVLVTGGISGTAQFPAPGLASAELYDPATGAWTATGSLHGNRWGHSAALLQNGKVLVAGGATIRSAQSVKALRTAELYDPAAGTWTEVAPMTDARSGHAAVVLPGGRVLVVGGVVPVAGDAEAALAFCEIFDPATGAWTPTGDLLAARGRHQATPLSDGTVLATGGSAPGGPGDGTFDPYSRATAELYTPATGKWTELPDMPSGRGLHRAVPLGQRRALVVGGAGTVRDGVGYANALVFDGVTKTWSPAGGLAVGRWGFAVAKLAGGAGVLVTGGVVRSGLAAAVFGADELTATTEVFAEVVVP
ncbi:kelch repeat-containing protein [Nonomuraea sp. NPDC050643]|uniref:Kelch repeat-containing protein n=1 Tax=Nonomuraea sp. NPDC050643 TaxID=3155660 RepID=UPI0033D4782C